MPLYQRGSLAKRIETNPLPISQVVRYGRQILAGVGAIHAAQTIHFDIKPSNVLFSDSDDAMVADFGQARDVGTGGVTLMPNRMYSTVVPPEAFTDGRRGTLLSDVYQVGLTVWCACNGKQLWDGQVAKHGSDLRQRIIDGKFPDRNLFLPHVPNRLRRAIRKALRVNPAERFASAMDFANSLSSIDVGYDWRPIELPESEFAWHGIKAGAVPLKVTLTKDGSSLGCRPLYKLRRRRAQDAKRHVEKCAVTQGRHSISSPTLCYSWVKWKYRPTSTAFSPAGALASSAPSQADNVGKMGFRGTTKQKPTWSYHGRNVCTV